MALWQPKVTTSDLDARMDNAYRRASGSVGFDISLGRGNANALRRAAGNAFDAIREGGPLFLQAGRGAMEMAGYRPHGGSSLQDMAGDILKEFFIEGTAAFQSAKAALYAEGLQFLKQSGLDDAHAATILSSADASFMLPDKESFTKEAAPLCRETLSPVMYAGITGIAVIILLVALIRSPVLAGIGGLAASGLAFYLAGGKRRRRAECLMLMLPRRLYDNLSGNLHSNIKRYADTVNAAVSAMQA